MGGKDGVAKKKKLLEGLGWITRYGHTDHNSNHPPGNHPTAEAAAAVVVI